MSKVEYEAMTDQELNLAIAEIKSGTPKEELRFAPPDYLHDDGATWRALMEMPYPDLHQNYPTGLWMCSCDSLLRRAPGQESAERVVWLCWLAWKEARP